MQFEFKRLVDDEAKTNDEMWERFGQGYVCTVPNEDYHKADIEIHVDGSWMGHMTCDNEEHASIICDKLRSDHVD